MPPRSWRASAPRAARRSPSVADVSRADDVDRLVRTTVERLGRVDILVNNAGIHIAKPVLETTEDDWDRTMLVNLKGPWLCSSAVAPLMIAQRGGTIINMSSNSGLYHPSAMAYTEYVTSKAGLNGLTKAMALALGPFVTVNAICPGWIRTDMIEELDPAVHDRILGETALARWGVPDDVAARGGLPRFGGRGLHHRRAAHRGGRPGHALMRTTEIRRTS